MRNFAELASRYFESVHGSDQAAASGEPEAQLTVPVSNLFVQLVEAAKLGTLKLIRESRLDRTRPDFAVLHTKAGKTHQKGYVELKAPDTSVDSSKWTGRNARQWELMKVEAEVLIVCNGAQAQLYRNGQPIGDPANLPFENATGWNPDPLTQLINRFLETNPTPITSVSDLSHRLAVRTADLRDRLIWLFDQSGPAADAARGGCLRGSSTFTPIHRNEILQTVSHKSLPTVWF